MDASTMAPYSIRRGWLGWVFPWDLLVYTYCTGESATVLTYGWIHRHFSGASGSWIGGIQAREQEVADGDWGTGRSVTAWRGISLGCFLTRVMYVLPFFQRHATPVSKVTRTVCLQMGL